ncbi:DUF1501 domain-containing protein [Emticicia sp. CRIBPO]|uniref:DUF1501 domain-containing protein n=1 Tax=Emticicia sp. CRIBPO TaxID=2683258 RepID=UPI0014127613|nr:DUF1501 domain-containing protein [Emticicia sp. CRIBPO]NBA87104.1 DUF1501 domain-containing protein [Emticicia sp. CRIBPO]
MKRRDFIANSLAASVLPVFLNGFSLSGLGSLGINDPLDDKVLVVIQLSGGNDGLNTVIPVSSYAGYRNARTNIAIPENKLIKIPQSDKIGLHPSMGAFSEMFKNGQATLIHDVGYPNPDFSHFRSTDIWNTASASDKVISSGWVGRYMADLHPGYPVNYPSELYPDPLAIQIGAISNLAFQSTVHSMGMSISDPSKFYDLIENKVEDVPDTLAGKELGYLRRVASQTNQYSEVIKAASAKVTQQKTYPNDKLSAQLKIVARLIAGGLRTQVYYVNLGGFDTHSGQTEQGDPTVGVHATLLKNLSESISVFYADLKALGVAKKVTGMTFSEFGRRIKSNASNGTDHGSSAPMFVFGDNVNPVVIGKPYDIPSNLSAADNVPMQYDFRSVYGTILQNWFCFPAENTGNVLFNNFQNLPIFKSGACGAVLTEENGVNPDFKNYPNPFQAQTNFEFNSIGGNCMIQVFDMMGRELKVALNGTFEPGLYVKPIDLSYLSTGVYVARFQNQQNQSVIRIVKA